MSIFNNFDTTGTVVKFNPVYADETLDNKFGVSETVKTVQYCITSMKEYETKSVEELRFEDYTLGRKGPQGQVTGLFSAKIQPSSLGSFSLKSIPVTPNFVSTSCGFGMTSQPEETRPFSKSGTGFSGVTTTSTFGLSFNTSPNVFSTDSPTKPLEITLASHPTNAATIPFSTQSSFEGFGNTNTVLGFFGIHQPEKTNNQFGVQQSANENLFGAKRVAPAFEEAELVSVGFGTSPSTSPFGKFQQTPFAQSEVSNNSGLIGSSTGSGVTVADSTETVLKCIPVTGIDTMVKFGVNQMISTRHHCITCMQEYESKSLEELRFEDYAAGRKGTPNQEIGLFEVPAQPSLFGIAAAGTSVATPSFGSTSGGFGTTSELGGTGLFNKPITGFSTPATPPLFSNTNTVPAAETGFGTTQNTAFGTFGKAQANKNIGLLNQNKCAFASPALRLNTNKEVEVQQVTSEQEAVSVLPFSSSNEFGGFESTSTTNTSSVSGAKPSGTMNGGNTNCVASSTSIMSINPSTQTATDAEQLIVKDDKIQQLTKELDSLKLDLKHFKNELKSSPSTGRKRIIIHREKEKDKLFQEEQQKNRRLMAEIENLRQQNNSLVNLNIELQKTMLNYTAKREVMLKYLLSENSIDNGNGDNTREANKEVERSNSLFDMSMLDKINSNDCGNGGDTKEAIDDKETPEIKKSLFIVEQSPKFTITVEDDYAGPRLEDEKVTFKFMEELVKYYKNQGKLHRNYACKILLDVKTLFESQPSLVDVEIPENGKFTIVGDIHGQFFDLLNIFEINGFPSETNPYLFNGDVVDRGSFSIECIFTLFGYKLLYPNHFFIARGNHESASMNEKYGFEDEVKSKYTPSMVSLFTQVFNWLPLAHCINSKVFVMHGGLFSKDDVTLDEIRRIDRNRQPPDMGIMCELLWSDPQSELGRGLSKRGGKRGLQFGPDVTKKFLEQNNLDYIVRSHEYKENGFDVCHDGKCITIFSAPNYCDTMGNQGAIMILNGKDMKSEFKSFEAVPHPIAMPIIAQPKRKPTAVFWIPCTDIN